MLVLPNWAKYLMYNHFDSVLVCIDRLSLEECNQLAAMVAFDKGNYTLQDVREVFLLTIFTFVLAECCSLWKAVYYNI